MYNHSMYTQNHNKKKLFFSLQYITMSGKNIYFNGKKINKRNFYKDKKINDTKEIDANNILASKEESYGNKNSFYRIQ